MMSKKDFEAVAVIIHTNLKRLDRAPPYARKIGRENLYTLAREFADYAGRENSLFNRTHFLHTCGFPPDIV